MSVQGVAPPADPFVQALFQLTAHGHFSATIQINREMLEEAERRFLRRDKHGNHHLSRGKLKKFRQAHEKWKRAQTMKQLTEVQAEINRNAPSMRLLH